MNNADLLIIGAGYCGEKLRQRLHCPATRTADKAIEGTHLTFDYRSFDKDTNVLPPARAALISIPPPSSAEKENFDSFIRLLEWCSKKYEQVFLYSTTSVYLQTKENEEISENTDYDCGHPRYAAEQIAAELGIHMLTLCGIWGPQRTPLSWIRRRIIRDHDSSVNLIHVDDICTLTEKLLGHSGPLPTRINLSSGCCHLWSEIAKDAGLQLQDPVSPSSRRPRQFTHKTIDNSLLLKLCGPYQFREDFNSEG